MTNLNFTVIIFLFLGLSASAQLIYEKNHNNNGVLMSEGWMQKDTRTKYWKFYRANGSKKSEGHFINGLKNKWWVFYDDKERIDYKCQMKDDQKNGICFKYDQGKIIAAYRFSKNEKIKKWTDLRSFKRDNNLRDLQ